LIAFVLNTDLLLRSDFFSIAVLTLLLF